MDKEFSKAVIRLVAAAFLLINALMTAKGVNPIPLDESQITDIASQAAAVVACVWVWWKNNNVTARAKATKELTNKIATGKVATVTVPEVEDTEPVTELESEYEMGDE